MCGVFGIISNQSVVRKGRRSQGLEASTLTALGLHALQHRGQQAGGIVTFDGQNFYKEYAQTKIGDYFNRREVIDSLPGDSAIGHVRYATSGDRAGNTGDHKISRNDIQPLFSKLTCGAVALAHNGNITNHVLLRQNLMRKGSLFQSSVDTEVIMHLMAQSKHPSTQLRIEQALQQVQGSFSLIALTENALIGVRDPYGIRPLVLGRTENSWVLASETCALDIIGATFERDVKAGEMIVLSNHPPVSSYPFPAQKKHFCIFEYVYFARPDSIVEELSVYEIRKQIGTILAQETPYKDADIVVPVPDSGVPAALGYAKQSGIPYELGIIRNHYVGRTFIEPSQTIRHFGLKLKHNVNQAVVEGKKIILIDDSLIRGNTMRRLVAQLYAAGASEIHVRISSPPTKYSCFYGIDTPQPSELLANQKSKQQMQQYINSKSLEFLSLKGLQRAIKNAKPSQFCDACFTGKYPIPIPQQTPKINAY